MAEKHQAEQMAAFIDRWLGNPVSKGVIGRLTRRCPKCGRRTEKILESYATGKKMGFCASCRFSSFLISKALDGMVSKTKIPKEMAKHHLVDPMWRKGLASVLEGIGKYGPQKPFTAYAPFLVVWNISRLCNLRCRHCYEFADKPRPDELDTAQALAAVDKMANAGVAYFAISGGEPPIRIGDIHEMITTCRAGRYRLDNTGAVLGEPLNDELYQSVKERIELG